MTTQNPRQTGVVDGVVAGLVATLVIMTLWGFGQQVNAALSDGPTPPGSPAKRFHLQVHDRSDNARINLRVPAALVESFAGLVGSDAVVRFDREIDDADLDLPRIWAGVKSLPAGQTWNEVRDGKSVSARLDGAIVEITVVEKAQVVSIETTDEDDKDEASNSAAPPEKKVASSATPPPPPAPPAVAKTPNVPHLTIIAGKAGNASSSPPSIEIDLSNKKEIVATDGQETVVLRLPVSFFERLEKQGKGSIRLDLAELVRDVRRLGPTEILSVESPSETVRISVD